MLEDKIKLTQEITKEVLSRFENVECELTKISTTHNMFADSLDEVELSIIGKQELPYEEKHKLELSLGQMFLPYVVKYYTELEYANSAIKDISTTIWQS